MASWAPLGQEQSHPDRLEILHAPLPVVRFREQPLGFQDEVEGGSGIEVALRISGVLIRPRLLSHVAGLLSQVGRRQG